jgi:hypothetical protein
MPRDRENKKHETLATPSIPIPPPRSAFVGLDQFFAVASAAALRALERHTRAEPDPNPWRPQIWVGIVARLEGGLVASGAQKGGPGGLGQVGGPISGGG